MVATVEEVEATVHHLLQMLDRVDPSYRAMMPSRRTIQATCTDLDLTYHAKWRNGHLTEVVPGPADGRPDIRISLDSDDLVALAEGELDFGRAYATDRIRIQASMTDLLRLRALL